MWESRNRNRRGAQLPETLQVGDADDLIDGPTFADVSTFTDIRSSVQTDTLINNKDSSLESTGKNDPQVEQVLLSSSCSRRYEQVEF